jgi:hypothetical protein
MKTVRMSGAAANQYKPPHPERTARRSAGGLMNFDVIFGEFPNRSAMLKTIEMQQKRERRSTDWKACVGHPSYL